MKLLICTPSYFKNGKVAISPKLATSLFAQETSCKWEWYIATEDCVPNDNMMQVNQNMAFKLNKGRQITLEQGFDALWWLPDDHVLGAGVLEQMTRFIELHKAGTSTHAIVSAPVRMRPSSMGMSHVLLMTYGKNNITDADTIGVGRPAVTADPSQSNRWHKNLKWLIPFEVAGGGLPMIAREVLEKVKFRQENQLMTAHDIGADLRFFSDAYRLGYKTLIVPVQIGHIDKGEEYWIDEAFYTELVDKNILGEIIKEYVLDGKSLLDREDNQEEEQVGISKVSE